MGNYELISAFFFWKISSEKSTFLRFTHQNLLTPPIVHNCCEIFFLFFFGGFPYGQSQTNLTKWWVLLVPEFKPSQTKTPPLALSRAHT